MIKSWIKKILNEFVSFPRVVYALFYVNSPNKLIVQAWCKCKPFALLRQDPLAHNNWGDDINYYFLKVIADKKKIILYPNSILAKWLSLKRLFFIGSIITFYSLKNAIICGSGILNGKTKYNIKGSTKKICIVRGPLTQKTLSEKGYDCPLVYGDPALLLPLYYKPNIIKKWKICIIPHFEDFSSPIIQEILSLNSPEIHIIRMRGYKKWTDVIDEICNCDLVFSSSLHGLIVAETYHIPNYWISLNNYVEGWNFKFKDFYFSIGKQISNPITITKLEDFFDLYQKKNEWKVGKIDYTSISESIQNAINIIYKL